MANVSRRTPGRGVDVPGLTQVGGAAILLNLIGLLACPWVAACALGFAVAWFILMAKVKWPAPAPRAARVGDGAMLLCLLADLIAGPCVGMFQWLPFVPAAAGVLGLFALGLLLLSAGGALRPGAAGTDLLLAAGMAAAVYGLGAPPGSKDHQQVQTRIIATVKDEAGRPMAGVSVTLTWQAAGVDGATGRGPWAETLHSNALGVASFVIEDDPRGRTALVQASFVEQPYREDGRFGEAAESLTHVVLGEVRTVGLTLKWIKRVEQPSAR